MKNNYQTKNIKDKNIYFIGIKGVGMTMLAQFLARQGNKVSGSDIRDTFLTDKVLRQEKIKVLRPPRVTNIPAKVDLIIYSSAFTAQNNVELAFILKNKERFKDTEILSYAACLGRVFNNYYGVAVCGSHGKTTTSAWLGYVLWRAGKSPNVLVGSSVPQFKGSALIGQSPYFIAEVDEYQNKLQYFNPQAVVLNNIEFDHPDFFPDQESYIKVFADFVKKIPPQGYLIVNNHDKEIRKIVKTCLGRVVTYDVSQNGLSVATVNYLAHDLQIKNNRQTFLVNRAGRFTISLFGEHNVYNALAVIASARSLRVSWKDIKKYLAEFKGTARRSQILGRYNQAIIIDDYAHHPSEIVTTLAGIKKYYPKKNIITVFHPHTYTRTKALFKDFISSFDAINELIVLDIYASAREKQGGVSSFQLVMAIKKYNKRQQITQNVQYIPKIVGVAKYLKKHLKKDDLLVLMGAGDVFRVGELLLKKQK